ncbi:membrane protein insertase YidC [Alloprevotella sp. oral taxon 473]|uniref:membrane protein insertase YidC n=1 Tax=Alloprevotella sp. oral taxon 473 TaxID=712469 RepID=UPI0002A3D9F9|nr:membrane protein insertase YidC [Alloprevotella sp. oral taxon 473]EKX88445.1 membrane protein insertase, YidC/Oxa1 family domain protein [Alloprevotella sp. oral taxon 473 str. F0040]
MDRNTITAVVLMALVVFGFSYWSSRNNTAEQAQTKEATELVEQKKTTANAAAKHVAAATVLDSTGLFAQAKVANDSVKPIILSNDKIEVTIAPKGGQISQVVLKGYKTYEDYKVGNNNDLVLYNSNDASMNFTLETKQLNIATEDLYFNAVNVSKNSVTMEAVGNRGEKLAFDYVLSEDYMLNMSLRSEGLSQEVSPKTKTIGVELTDHVRQFEKGFYFENQYSTLSYKDVDGSSDHLKEHGDDEQMLEESVEWVAFKNQYFSSCFIAKEPLSNVKLTSVSEDEKNPKGYLKQYSAQMETAFDPSGKTPAQFQWYFGPNNFRLLQSMDKHSLTPEHDIDLEKLVYLGWPVVRWVNRFFTIYVFDFLTSFNLPMWLVLVLITLILRVIVYPSTKKSFMSSAKQRVLRPKVEKINEKYKDSDNALQRQQEIQSLYSQHGVSMMGGCLPMLIQMPIWIAMFNFVPNAIELRQQSFLWADDLSAYDDLISWSTDIWGLGNHLSLFCILFCLSNVLYSVMTMRQQRDSMAAAGQQAQQMKIMQYMMFLMPVMFFFMFNKYSSGLNFYYFISLLSSAITMWYLRWSTDDAKLLAKLEATFERNKNNPQKKPSGLSARLAALAAEQQKLVEEQRKRNAQQK